MSEDNPYAAPTTRSGPVAEGGDHFTSTMVEHLLATRPWVRFLSVLGFIGAAFMLLGGIGMMVVSPSMPRTSSMTLGPFGGALGGLYLVLAAVYVVFSVMLSRYASAIDRVQQGGGATAIEDALQRQRSFWKTAGIATVIGIILGILAFVGGTLMAVMLHLH